MFNFLSFRELIAQLQAEQDARAQRLVEEGRQEIVTVQTGDDVAAVRDGITVTEGEDGPVITGDLPDNANLEVNGVEIALEDVEPAAAPADEPEAEAEAAPEAEPAVAENTVVEGNAPIELTGNGSVTITQGEDGPIIDADLSENATLEVGGGATAPEDAEPAVAPVNVPEPIEVTGEVFEGQDSRDSIFGTAGNDIINGNGGNDFLRGGGGDDVISGGTGRDRLDGGAGDDTYVYNTGDGRDLIRNFDLLGNDTLQLNIEGVNNLDDFLDNLVAVSSAGDAQRASFDFGNGDRLDVILESVDSLTEDDFLFA